MATTKAPPHAEDPIAICLLTRKNKQKIYTSQPFLGITSSDHSKKKLKPRKNYSQKIPPPPLTEGTRRDTGRGGEVARVMGEAARNYPPPPAVQG